MGERAFKTGEVLKFPYKIVDYLGSGGMGEVYLATNVNLKDSKFAVKTLLRDATTPENVERFVGEAQVLAKLRHPNIVQAFDFGKTPTGQPFLVMEFVEGTELAGEMKRGPMAPGDVLGIIGQLAGALAAMHGKGIFHRDVKPQNIFLIDCGVGLPRSAKILDFGIATDLQAPGLTRAGQTVGTVMYMAPERFASEAKAGQHTDQYALATIAYELLSGQKAFGGETQKVIDTKKDGNLPFSLPSPMPDTLRVIHRGMAPDPTKRYPSVSDFHCDLVNAIKVDATSKDQPEIPPAAPPKNLPRPSVLDHAALRFDSLQPTALIPTDVASGPPATLNLAAAPGAPPLSDAIQKDLLVPTAVLPAELVAPSPMPTVFDDGNDSAVQTALLPVAASPRPPSEVDREVVQLSLPERSRQAQRPTARREQAEPRQKPGRPDPERSDVSRPALGRKWLPPVVIAAAIPLVVLVTYWVGRQPRPAPPAVPDKVPATIVETTLPEVEQAALAAPRQIGPPDASPAPIDHPPKRSIPPSPRPERGTSRVNIHPSPKPDHGDPKIHQSGIDEDPHPEGPTPKRRP